MAITKFWPPDPEFNMINAPPRDIARALGGEVAGRDTVLCPGPGHSQRDRSLAVKLDAAAPDGFLIYSHADDDWRTCRDYVRQRLGQPQWQPGDEQRRSIPPRHIDKWDLSAIEAEIDLLRMICFASRVHAKYGTKHATRAAHWLKHICKAAGSM
jgi:hypothetical protein